MHKVKTERYSTIDEVAKINDQIKQLLDKQNELLNSGHCELAKYYVTLNNATEMKVRALVVCAPSATHAETYVMLQNKDFSIKSIEVTDDDVDVPTDYAGDITTLLFDDKPTFDAAAIDKLYDALRGATWEEFGRAFEEHICGDEDCMSEFEIKCELKEMLS